MDYHVTTIQIVGLSILAVWEITWKGIAMWKASQNKQLGWYVAILILNTAGILPIAYLLISRGDSHGNN